MRVRLAQALIVALAGVAFGASPARASLPPYAPGEVLAKFKGSPQEQAIDLPAGVNVREGVRYLRSSPKVAYANPNYLARASALWDPNDPGSGDPLGWERDQWNFLAPNPPNRGGSSIQGAWENLRGSARPGGWGVTVAELDTGVAYRIKGSKYGVDPDLPPLSRFVSPKDFVDGDPVPLDEEGHGTHVASTIVQTTDNGLGLTGVAYAANLMPIRVLNRQEVGTAANVARGIRYAVDRGADVINLSLQFKAAVNKCSQIPAVCAAVKMAANHGVVVVAAAGNGHRSKVAYPARAPGVIAVGGTTYRGCLGDYSNYGMGLDLVAPGGGVDTGASHPEPALRPGGAGLCDPPVQPRSAGGGKRATSARSGSSGCEAPRWRPPTSAEPRPCCSARHPWWSPKDVRSRLVNCAVRSGSATFYGAGLLDAARATASGAC